jgi:hypothetical protein
LVGVFQVGFHHECVGMFAGGFAQGGEVRLVVALDFAVAAVDFAFGLVPMVIGLAIRGSRQSS